MSVLLTTGLFLAAGLAIPGNLILRPQAADSLLAWMDRGCPKAGIPALASLPGHKLMEQLLLAHEPGAVAFRQALEGFDPADSASGSAYGLYDACRDRKAIAELSGRIKAQGLAAEAYKRAAAYFPKNNRPSRDPEVFFTAAGWRWGDAMSFGYAIKDGECVLSDSGAPAIMFNLALVCQTYGSTLAERMEGLKDVMAHELFHALLSGYPKADWPKASGDGIGSRALNLLMNEGLAHYVSDGKLLKDGYKADGKLREREDRALAALAEAARSVFDITKSEAARSAALEAGLSGKYWDKYLCIAGLFMAYHIERSLGAGGLRDCVRNGPAYFVKQYQGLRSGDASLPHLPQEMARLAAETGPGTDREASGRSNRDSTEH